MKISINGGHREWLKETIAYEELVEAAGLCGNPTATYEGPWRGDSQRSGIMIPGKVVTIEDGMSFHAYHTGNG